LGLQRKISEHAERQGLIENYVENFWFLNVTDKLSNSAVQEKVFKLVDSILKTEKIPSTGDELHNSFNETQKSPSRGTQA
jgi:hypothetical protein